MRTMRDKTKKAAYQKEYHKKWYANSDNAKKKKQQARNSNAKILERNIAYVNSYKATQSCKCGENDIACLDFHHIDPSIKDDTVCALVRKCCSIKRIQEEIDKCIIMCSNCHRKFHYYNTGD